VFTLSYFAYKILHLQELMSTIVLEICARIITRARHFSSSPQKINSLTADRHVEYFTREQEIICLLQAAERA